VEIQQFNKGENSTKTGKLEIQQIRIYHKNSKTGILWSCIVRNSDVQEFRKTTVCPSGTLPPDNPQIWNGRICTLIMNGAFKWCRFCCTLNLTPNHENLWTIAFGWVQFLANLGLTLKTNFRASFGSSFHADHNGAIPASYLIHIPRYDVSFIWHWIHG